MMMMMMMGVMIEWECAQSEVVIKKSLGLPPVTNTDIDTIHPSPHLPHWYTLATLV